MKKKKQPTLNLSKLKEEGIIHSSIVTNASKQRLLKLKFYFDNPERLQKNKLATFEVESPEHAIRVIVKFESEGATIRAAFLNPNDKSLGSKMGFRFEYHDHPTYKFLKGSN